MRAKSSRGAVRAQEKWGRQGRGASKTGTAPLVSLRFRERKEFGNFCMALTDGHVPFSHAGFKTVVIAQSRLERLPAQPRKLFKEFKSKGYVEVSITPSVRKRIVVTAEEARKRLKEVTGRWSKYGALE